MNMQERILGNSDLSITPIGVGAWAMGGSGWAFSWGPQDDKDSIAAIHTALEAGVNWIDTAAVYGLGHSEEVVGRALKGLGQRPYVFTKCELTWNEKGEITGTLKADSIRRECEASLRRLGIDVIDLYQIHWPDPEADIEARSSVNDYIQHTDPVLNDALEYLRVKSNEPLAVSRIFDLRRFFYEGMPAVPASIRDHLQHDSHVEVW
jgi:aryl-alcohol dehydrogenase-like predicted oxidoreductase